MYSGIGRPSIPPERLLTYFVGAADHLLRMVRLLPLPEGA
jgi:hypothetical protein